MPDEGSGSRRARRAAFGGLAALVLVAVVGLWVTGRDESGLAAGHGEPVPTTASTTSLLTSTGPVAPLTGLAVDPADGPALQGPALVAKVDGAAAAVPQLALGDADVVVELRVEGISRYMAAWHSRIPEEIGPVRSARTSDPDVLAAFGRPVFAYSGANEGTLRRLEDSPWFVDASHDAGGFAYRRDPERRAPHDLVADAPGLLASARATAEDLGEEQIAPSPVLSYRRLGEPAPGEPVAGVAVEVGSGARFVWDPQRRGWRRWAHATAHATTGGSEAAGPSPGDDQLAPTNVVVLETDYVASAADPKSPEAITVGSGRAWVLSDGRMATGTWERSERDRGWDLRDDLGAPLLVEPGTTWVVLADQPPRALDGDEVAALPSPVPSTTSEAPEG